MEEILKQIEENMERMYLEIIYVEMNGLADELGISSIELITNMVAQDIVTMKEMNELDKLLNKYALK